MSVSDVMLHDGSTPNASPPPKPPPAVTKPPQYCRRHRSARSVAPAVPWVPLALGPTSRPIAHGFLDLSIDVEDHEREAYDIPKPMEFSLSGRPPTQVHGLDETRCGRPMPEFASSYH